MSDKYNLTGIHGIRRYVWHLLETELGWNKSSYRGATPIITPQQSPEFNDFGAPYIVYNYSHAPSGPDFYIDREQAIFTVYSSSELEIRKTINLLYSHFKAHDESAKLVNYWLSKSGSAANRNFDYKMIRVTSSVGPRPALQEGGRHEGTISIYYAYTLNEPRVDFGVGPATPEEMILPPEPEPEPTPDPEPIPEPVEEINP